MSSQYQCPTAPSPPPGAVCWICLDSGPSEAEGDELARNCACRGGSAGFAHASCLAEHARRQSEKAVKNAERTGDYDGGNSASDPWRKCPQCMQYYMGNLALAMAERFVASCQGMPDFAYPRYYALLRLGSARLDCEETDGAVEVYEGLLKEFERVEMMNQLLGMGDEGIKDKELDIYEGLMVAYYDKGMKETTVSSQEAKIKNARDCGEKALEIIIDLFGRDSSRASQTEAMLTQLRSICAVADKKDKPSVDTADVLRKARSTYEEFMRDFGPGSLQCLGSALTLSIALQEDGKLSEAVDLLDNSLTTSQRSLGREHQTTQVIDEALRGARERQQIDSCGAFEASASTSSSISATIVGLESQPELNGKQIDVLRRTKEGNKYIVRLRYGDKEPAKFKAVASNFILSSGTSVKVMDLKSAQHLNGKDGTVMSYNKGKKRYDVSIKDGNNFRGFLKPENLEIVFP